MIYSFEAPSQSSCLSSSVYRIAMEAGEHGAPCVFTFRAGDTLRGTVLSDVSRAAERSESNSYADDSRLRVNCLESEIGRGSAAALSHVRAPPRRRRAQQCSTTRAAHASADATRSRYCRRSPAPRIRSVVRRSAYCLIIKTKSHKMWNTPAAERATRCYRRSSEPRGRHLPPSSVKQVNGI